MKIVCSAFIFSLLAVFLINSPSLAEDRRVKIGLVAPLTLGNAKMGEDIQHAAEIVVQTFNQKSARHRKYELILEDGKCGSGNAATTAVSKLVSLDHVDALIVSCSGEILQTASFIEQHRVPTMVVYGSHPQIKNLGPHIFRVFMDSERDIPIVANRMRQDGRQHVAIISEEIAFAVGVRDVLKKELTNRVSATFDYKEGEQDFRALLLRIKSTKPDALFLNPGSVETLGPLVRQISEMKLNLPLYSFAYPAVPSFAPEYGQMAEGLIFVGPPDLSSPAALELLEKYQAQFHTAPNIPFVAATSFDGVTALLTAVEQTENLSPEEIVAALSKYSNLGVLGSITFDKNGDVEGVHYVLRKISDGKIVRAN